MIIEVRRSKIQVLRVVNKHIGDRLEVKRKATYHCRKRQVYYRINKKIGALHIHSTSFPTRTAAVKRTQARLHMHKRRFLPLCKTSTPELTEKFESFSHLNCLPQKDENEKLGEPKLVETIPVHANDVIKVIGSRSIGRTL
ncbi:hypothetical protein TNCV_2205771 [Trichonephila clavipes]|nr:hypothetical protein TNCV_2205771 [Trichonephila clavipes]